MGAGTAPTVAQPLHAGARTTGEYWEQRGQWLQAVELYQRGLELDRSSEELYRRLMIAYRELGYYGEALAVYRRCCGALHTTFGITPSAATEAVRASLPPVNPSTTP